MSGKAEVMRVWLLGGFRVSVRSRVVRDDSWRLRKAASLVKLLALAPNHRLHREQVMEALWPNLGLRAASNNLRQALHVARRVLEPDPTIATRYLSLRDEQLVISPEGRLWVDVEAFEEAAATARHAQDPAAYRAAIELYAGELLPGDRYEEWAHERRERLRTTYLELLVNLAGLYQERGEYGPAIALLCKVVIVEHASEEAHAGLMRLYALSGHEVEALHQYERLRGAMRRELGTEPDVAIRRLRQDIEAGIIEQAGPAPVHPSLEELPDANKHNLPAPRSSFVGREQEMLKVKRELAMTRLMTLTGAGGSGKTSLALKVAGDLVGAYPDGVWLVELAPLVEGELVPQAVAGALGVREQPGRLLTDMLTEALQSKQTLLVMDNCEHLIDAAAHLADALLDSCPRLRILATSREALGITGEAVWLVPPLSVPEQTRSPSVEELEGYESVRLLVERARRRNPAFTLTSENAQAVAEICRRLEGLPLALELAAARVGLSAEQIAARLEDSLKLLTGGSRTALPRQRTLRGMLDWSHELLSEPEQKLFRRLSIFAGGWTLGAAEVVGSGESTEEADVLELLSGLVDKSLVVAEASKGSGVRYRMLEPIRQYAREKLEASREAEETLRRYAEFFLALAEEADPAVEGAHQRKWLDRLETEHDNLRVALSWSLQLGEDAELALRMGAALGEFWYLRGYFGEGRKWLEEALERSGQASTAVRARALHRVAWLVFLQGHFDRAKGASEEGLALQGVEFFRTGSGDSIAAELQRTLGMVMGNRGESERAKELYQGSLALSRQIGSLRGMALSLFCLGGDWKAQGDFERAAELLEEALTMFRETGDPALIASVLTHLGSTFVLQGDLDRATAFLDEAVTMLREQGHRVYLATALAYLGWAALLRGNSERARALHTESLELRRKVGDNPAASESLGALACVAEAQGEGERATRLFGAAQMLREAMGMQQDPNDRVLQEPYLAAARSRVDETAWETAWEEGRFMGQKEALEYALSEERFIAIAPNVPEELSPDAPPPAALTPREGEIAALLVQGFTNRQIASELSISEHTVHRHVAGILKKLNLHSREQVASRLAER